MDEMIGEFIILNGHLNHYGQCKTEDDTLRMEADVVTGEPVVISERTGKAYRLTWVDICNLAMEAGVGVKGSEAN